MTSPGGLRIAMYCQDSFGLGHLRRTTLIGHRILEDSPGSTVLLFADSPVAPFFELPAGMDVVKLPSAAKVDTGQWQPTSLRVCLPSLLRMRANLLRQAVQDYEPDVLLVDHMPGGIRGELIPTLEWLRRRGIACRVVLGLRDILDAQHVTIRTWKQDRAYDTLRRFYDQILIYGSHRLFDTAAMYQIPTPYEGIHYAGYVVNKGPIQPVSGLWPTWHQDGQRLVYVAAGGGRDGSQLMHAYLSALRLLGTRDQIATLMVIGPNCPASERQALEAEAGDLPVRIVRSVDDSLSAMAAADVVVSMAGYNTVAEILHLRKRAIIVPRSGPSAEQTTRTLLLRELGLVEGLLPGELSSVSLAARLDGCVAQPRLPHAHCDLPTDGDKLAAARLLERTSERVHNTA